MNQPVEYSSDPECDTASFGTLAGHASTAASIKTWIASLPSKEQISSLLPEEHESYLSMDPADIFTSRVRSRFSEDALSLSKADTIEEQNMAHIAAVQESQIVASIEVMENAVGILIGKVLKLRSSTGMGRHGKRAVWNFEVALEKLRSMLGCSLFNKMFNTPAHATEVTRKWTLALQKSVISILDCTVEDITDLTSPDSAIEQSDRLTSLNHCKLQIAKVVREMGSFCKGDLQTKEDDLSVLERYDGHTSDRQWIRWDIRDALAHLNEELGEWEHTENEMDTNEDASDTDSEMDTGV